MHMYTTTFLCITRKKYTANPCVYLSNMNIKIPGTCPWSAIMRRIWQDLLQLHTTCCQGCDRPIAALILVYAESRKGWGAFRIPHPYPLHVRDCLLSMPLWICTFWTLSLGESLCLLHEATELYGEMLHTHLPNIPLVVNPQLGLLWYRHGDLKHAVWKRLPVRAADAVMYLAAHENSAQKQRIQADVHIFELFRSMLAQKKLVLIYGPATQSRRVWFLSDIAQKFMKFEQTDRRTAVSCHDFRVPSSGVWCTGA